MSDSYVVDQPQLPAFPGQAPGPITIHPSRARANATTPSEGTSADPWAAAGFSDKPTAPPPAVAPQAAAAPSAGGDPWAGAGFTDKPPADVPQVPKRQMGGEEAAGRGLVDSLTFGFGPAIAGVAEASGMPSAATKPDEIDVNPIRPLVGAYKMLDDWIAGHKDPTISEAYERGRKAALSEQQLASEQHPWAYLAGQAAGAIAVPMGAGGAAVTGAGRMGRAAAAGGTFGGLYGAGEATSEGKGIKDVAKGAGKGAATGAVFGAGGAGIVETGGKVAQKVASVARGKVDPEAEAARRVVGNLEKDAKSPTGLPFDREAHLAGDVAGTPRVVADIGGENTRALTRSAANTSPSGRQLIEETTGSRFSDQYRRLSDYVRSKIGGGNATVDIEKIEAAGRAAKGPAYKRAYAAGSGGVWSPELERLISSEAVPRAMQGAVERGRNRAVSEGMGAFNPKVTFENGVLKFRKGEGGVPAYPDIQFWDYTQRELRDMAKTAQRAGRDEEAGALFGLHTQLNNELDRIVPLFKAARSTAHDFFKASNALEAGENFVKLNVSLAEAQKIVAAMSAPERELFRRGFASKLADEIYAVGDKANVLDRTFLQRGPARDKIYMALGSKDARELEALLRVETMIDKTRKSLWNSTTVRQRVEEGMAGAGAGAAVAAVEGAKEGEIDMKYVLGGAILAAGARAGARKIDERVATKVAEMLMSSDPAVLARGYRTVTSRPELFEAIRHATASGARVGAHDVGPDRTAAAALVGAHNLVEAATPREKKNSSRDHDQGQNQPAGSPN